MLPRTPIELHRAAGAVLFVDSTGQSAGGQLFAMSVLAVLPIFLFFLFFLFLQRLIIERVDHSGMKR